MQYLTFSPYYSGLSNVIMSYEIALAIAHITKRTVVLPPDCWMLFLAQQKMSDYIDIWHLLDKESLLKNFDCVEHKDVPEFQKYMEQIKDHRSYTAGLSRLEKDILNVRFGEGSLSCTTFALTNGMHTSEDFNDFTKERHVVNVESSKKFLHFENNLFGYFAYYVYAPGYKDRNEVKQRVNAACAYHPRFFERASKVKQQIGPYNAVHVRRGDFASIRDGNLLEVNDATKLCSRLEQMYDPAVPLYVATDERSPEFFDEARKKFKLFFFRDFNFNASQIDEAVLEQVICSEAELFYGTYLSTYTTRINVIRGVSNKQTCSYGGINHFITAEQSGIDFSEAFPWKQQHGRWNWEQSCHFQWVKELQDGILETSNV